MAWTPKTFQPDPPAAGWRPKTFRPDTADRSWANEVAEPRKEAVNLSEALGLPRAVEGALAGSGSGSTQGFIDELAGYGSAVAGEARRLGQRAGVVEAERGFDVEPSKSLTITKRLVPTGPQARGGPPRRNIVSRETIPARQIPPEEPKEGSAEEDYRAGRDSLRSYIEEERRESPRAFFVSELGGDLLTQGAIAAATGGASVTPAGQAAIGGLSGLGHSEADLTRPTLANISKAGASMAGGALLSYGAGKAGQKLSTAWSDGPVARYLGDKGRAASADAAKAITDKAQKAVRSTTSAVGGEVSAARNAIETAEEILTSAAATPEQKAAAKAFLDSPEAAELIRNVYGNVLERIPGHMGRIGTAREALDVARRAATPEAIDAATDLALSKPMDPIKRFGLTYATRTVPPLVGTAVGRYLDDGGWGGTLAGGAVGGVLGVAMGNPGTAAKNIVNNPAVRRAFWSTVEAVPDKAVAAMGRFGPVLQRELQDYGLDGVIAMDLALGDNAEWQEARARALQLLGGVADR